MVEIQSVLKKQQSIHQSTPQPTFFPPFLMCFPKPYLLPPPPTCVVAKHDKWPVAHPYMHTLQTDVACHMHIRAHTHAAFSPFSDISTPPFFLIILHFTAFTSHTHTESSHRYTTCRPIYNNNIQYLSSFVSPMINLVWWSRIEEMWCNGIGMQQHYFFLPCNCRRFCRHQQRGTQTSKCPISLSLTPQRCKRLLMSSNKYVQTT